MEWQRRREACPCHRRMCGHTEMLPPCDVCVCVSLKLIERRDATDVTRPLHSLPHFSRSFLIRPLLPRIIILLCHPVCVCVCGGCGCGCGWSSGAAMAVYYYAQKMRPVAPTRPSPALASASNAASAPQTPAVPVVITKVRLYFTGFLFIFRPSFFLSSHLLIFSLTISPFFPFFFPFFHFEF